MRMGKTMRGLVIVGICAIIPLGPVFLLAQARGQHRGQDYNGGSYQTQYEI